MALPAPVVRRLIREQAGLSQREIGDVLGVTAAAVSQYETGSRDPGRQVRDKYVALLDSLQREVLAG